MTERACIIGSGSAGSRLAKRFQRHGIEIAFLHSSRNSGNNVPANYEGALSFRDKREVLEWEPNFVVVANPSALHYSAAKWALITGLDVFIEKPMTTAYEDSARLVELARHKKLLVFSGFQQRHYPKIKELRTRFLINREMGELKTFNFSWQSDFRNWHPGERVEDSYTSSKALGGGAINTMSHELDLLNYFFEDISEVRAFGIGSNEFDVELSVHVDIVLGNKTCGRVELEMDAGIRRRVCQFSFEGGFVLVDFERQLFISSTSGGPETQEFFDDVDPYMNEVSEFLRLRRTRDFLGYLEDQLRTEKLIGLVRDSVAGSGVWIGSRDE